MSDEIQQAPPETAPETIDPVAPDAEPIVRDDIADGVFRHLDPASRTVDTIASWIVAGVILVPSLVVIAIVALTKGISPWVAVGWSLLLILLSVLAIVSPRLTYKYSSYAVSGLGIEIRRGWLWQRALTVPRSRVQHTDVTQGPLQRKFGIARIVVHTAGSENHSVELIGLPHDRALRIRDHLVHAREDSDGV